MRSAVAPWRPTSEGALRQSRAAVLDERTHAPRVGRDGPAALRMGEHGHEPRGCDGGCAVGDDADRVVDLEPRARELEQDGARSLEHEAGRLRPRELRSGTPPSRAAGRAPTRRPPPASGRARSRTARRARTCGEMCPRTRARGELRTESPCPPRARSGRARAPPRSCARRRRPRGRRASGRRRSRSCSDRSGAEATGCRRRPRIRPTASSRLASEDA